MRGIVAIMLWLVALPASADITLRDGFVAPVAQGADADLFIVLDNDGQRENHVTGASSPFAASVDLIGAGAQGILVPEKARADLVPGAEGHLRLRGATVDLADGDRLLLTIIFDRVGPRLFEIAVQDGRLPLLPGPRR